MGSIFRRSSQQQQQRRRRRRKRSIEYRPAVCSKYTYKRPENDTRRAFCCWDDTLCRMVAARNGCCSWEGRDERTDAECRQMCTNWDGRDVRCWLASIRLTAAQTPARSAPTDGIFNVQFRTRRAVRKLKCSHCNSSTVSFGWKKCFMSFQFLVLMFVRLTFTGIHTASFFSLCLLRVFVYIIKWCKQIHAGDMLDYGRPALRSRCGHYIFALWFLSFSLPNLSGRRVDVYHTSTHGVALVRI